MNSLQTVWKGVRRHSTTPCPTLYPHPYTWALLLEEPIPILTLMPTPTPTLIRGASIASSSTPATHIIHTILIMHITTLTSSVHHLLPL